MRLGPLVEEVKHLEANLTYAYIKYPDGSESAVFLKDLAPYPNEASFPDAIPSELSPSPTQQDTPLIVIRLKK